MIDRPLVGWVYQPIADRIMDLALLSCFWLAGHCAVVSAISAVLMALATTYRDGMDWLVAVDWCLCSIVVPFAYQMWRDAERQERRTNASEIALRAPRSTLISLWFCFFWLDALQAVDAFFAGRSPLLDLPRCGFSGSMLSYYCFMACVPKPPRRQRRKQIATAPA